MKFLNFITEDMRLFLRSAVHPFMDSGYQFDRHKGLILSFDYLPKNSRRVRTKAKKNFQLYNRTQYK